MSDPTDYEALEEIQFLTNSQIEIAMASRAQISKALTRLFYGDQDQKDGPAAEEQAAQDQKAKSAEVEPGLERALIPLLVEKGIITLQELKDKARELDKS